MIFIFSLLALGNGGLLIISQLLNAALGLRVGPMGSSFVNHAMGAIFGALLLLVGFGAGKLALGGFPLWYLSGGCMGVLIVALFSFSVPRVGAMVMSLLWTSAQLLMSSLIDHFGWLGGEVIPMTITRCAGIGLLMLGSYLVFFGRRTV